MIIDTIRTFSYCGDTELLRRIVTRITPLDVKKAGAIRNIIGV